MVPFLSFVSPFLFNRFIRVCLPIYSSIYLLIHFFYSSIHLLNHFLHRFFPVNVSLILPYLPSHLSSLFFTLLAHASFFGSGPVGDDDPWFHHIKGTLRSDCLSVSVCLYLKPFLLAPEPAPRPSRPTLSTMQPPSQQALSPFQLATSPYQFFSVP